MKLYKFLLLALALLVVGCGAQLPNGSSPTPSPTKFARSSSPTELSLPQTKTTGTPEKSTETPTVVQTTSEPSITPIADPSSTSTLVPTPSAPLQLRDDLPAMALKDFPRPADDNGLGIHFLASGYYSSDELDKQIARMQSMHLKWALVIYADENQLMLAVPKFKAAGITVVWRKTLRPYQHYFDWRRDVQILQAAGMPPYMQLYNEPELEAEWDNNTIDKELFMNNLFQAARDVYNAGGYPGVQFIDEDWLRLFITETYARQGQALFHRMFFVPHSYGLNHPPDYTEDINGVLGFRTFARIFFMRLGFVPPFIVGEGGWKLGESEDARFPAIDETLHHDYTLSVFNWFSIGKMSNGGPLPDYLFAFCPWMLAGKLEAGAWFDSFNGDRTLTIQGVQQIPPFGRKFSWGK